MTDQQTLKTMSAAGNPILKTLEWITWLRMGPGSSIPTALPPFAVRREAEPFFLTVS
jgi:hypothetical protein